jgi:putative transposase
MKLTERIQLKKTPRLTEACHRAKNLYNLANYYVRQEFFNLGNWLRYEDLWHALKDKDAHARLPSQTSQQVLKMVDLNWKSFFNAMKEWRSSPGRFYGRPRPPRYKRKNGEYPVVFTKQQCRIKAGYLHFPKKTKLKPVKTRLKNQACHVRIIPRGIYYVLEIIHEQEKDDLKLNKDHVAGIDLGLTNVVTIVNNAGLKPVIIKGGIVKSMNQFYNKQSAKFRSVKDRNGTPFETNRLKKLALNRNNKIHDTFHKISRAVITYCIVHDLGTIVIGYNPSWKQGITTGKVNNQNFVHVPFFKLIGMITYKAELVGITVVLVNEAYTSKCSFLDHEPIRRQERYQGHRVSRGLFRSQDKTCINADVNAACNIVKKAFPNAFLADGIEGVGLHPFSLSIS